MHTTIIFLFSDDDERDTYCHCIVEVKYDFFKKQIPIFIYSFHKGKTEDNAQSGGSVDRLLFVLLSLSLLAFGIFKLFLPIHLTHISYQY